MPDIQKTEPQLDKFVPFSKVDEAQRIVYGIVTAERPDQDREVCDYEKSKPYYEAWSERIKKNSDGANLGNLREMHQLWAVGKGLSLEFNDPEQAITMSFKVVDDDAWKKVQERVYTGFSQGGRKVGEMKPDPVYKGCMRYVANPAEVSLVDNPCLPDARFAYVKADGQVEIRKFLRVITDTPESRITALENEVSLLKAATGPTVQTPATTLEKGKTKRVAGKDLPPSAFAYVGDPDKTETWKLPVHDANHARNALARFNQTEGIPASEKSKVRAKIVAAARKYGIDVASENEKVMMIGERVRKAVRIWSNQNPDCAPMLKGLDYDLGKLQKGSHDVSPAALNFEKLASEIYCLHMEQEWEIDKAELPEMLGENVSNMVKTIMSLLDVRERVAA